MNSIDVIIPSYRLNKKCLLASAQMKKPKNVEVRFIIVADNPGVKIPIELNPFINDGLVSVIVNKKNEGAQESRNIGIDNSSGEWIIFLDDDVIPEKNLLVNYCKASGNNNEAIGFFGETIFPPPFNSFTKGIITMDKLAFFFIAARCDELKWATTSNVAIKRSAIGDIRFQKIFPKNGGGEDLDFFLKIYRKTGKELKALNNVKVYHDWWNEGRRSYKRFYRWSYGNAIVNPIFPEYLFYEAPNLVESMFLGGLVLLTLSFVTGSFIIFWSFVFGFIFGEVVIEFIRLYRNKSLVGAKFTLEVVLINIACDFGQLYSQLFRLKRIKGICERFDHYCDGEHVEDRQQWSTIKFISSIICSLLAFVLLR